LRDAETGSEVALVRVQKAAGIAILAADEHLRRATGEDEIGIGVADVDERTHVFVAQAHLEGGVAGELIIILHETIGGPIAELHQRDAGLALLHGGEAEEKTGKAGACAVIGGGLRGVAVGELVVAAILEKSPHRPNVAAIAAAEFETVATALPA
jgi:hypothetical protein